jgi:16S rRNA (uracil1498-N3)-methyltransferase
VALPLLKSGRFEWAIEKLTEIGVAKIVPIMTARSVVRYEAGQPEEFSGKLKRWQAIAREAAEQCERGLIPDMVRPVALDKFLTERKSVKEELIIGAERSGARGLAELLASGEIRHFFRQASPDDSPAANHDAASLVVLVGPEGGLTRGEFELAFATGAKPVTLGKRILRTETAALYAASLLIGHLDK